MPGRTFLTRAGSRLWLTSMPSTTSIAWRQLLCPTAAHSSLMSPMCGCWNRPCGSTIIRGPSHGSPLPHLRHQRGPGGGPESCVEYRVTAYCLLRYGETCAVGAEPPCICDSFVLPCCCASCLISTLHSQLLWFVLFSALLLAFVVCHGLGALAGRCFFAPCGTSLSGEHCFAAAGVHLMDLG